MNPETQSRVKCPSCIRMAGRLVRKIEGRYVGYTRSDGSSIYSCPWEDGCLVEDFVVNADGSIVDVKRTVLS